MPHILASLDAATVGFTIRVHEPIRNGHHGIALYNHNHELIWGWATDGVELSVSEYGLCHTFPMLPVRPGAYNWLVSLYEDGDEVDVWDCLPEMIVATKEYQHTYDEWNVVLNVPTEFSVSRS